MSKHRKTMEAWFRRVWTQEDQKTIDEMFVPSGKAEGLGELITGPNEFKAFQEAMLKLVSDVNVSIDNYMEDGDRVFLTGTFRAKKRDGSGTVVEMKGSGYMKMDKGVIVDAENYWDFISFYEQLGLLSRDTFMRALSGEKLC